MAATAIRPLTLQERQKPAQLSFHGGFRNVSFQLGEVVLPESSRSNVNATTASFVKGFIRKSPTIEFPIIIPNSLMTLRGVVNTIATVAGQKNNSGGYDAVLQARATERLSSFNTKLRTVEHLIESKKVVDEVSNNLSDDDAARLGKSSNARSHNQVMLAGVVVGAKFEDGQNPRFHIWIRQDSNPTNVIPLVYEARNASSMVTRIKFGSIIYADGEFVYRNVPNYQTDESGVRKLDINGQVMPVLDDAGKPVRRLQTYIRITAPKDPAEFDLDLGNSIPSWMAEIAKKIAEGRTRSQAPTKEAAPAALTAPAAPLENPLKTTFAGIPSSIDDL